MKKIIAHRGDSLNYPENSISAFCESLKNNNFNGLETDLKISKDGILFCFHDDDLLRMTNSSDDKLIEHMDWNEIKQLYLKTNNNDVSQYKIPSLESLLIINQKHKKILNLEIKSDSNIFSHEELIYQINRLINKYDMIDYVLMSSFDNSYFKLCQNYNMSFGLLIMSNKLPSVSDKLPNILILDKNTDECHVCYYKKNGYILGIFTLNEFNNSSDPNYLHHFDYLIKDKL